MCGIAGLLQPNHAADRLESTVRAMTNALVHRGPDAGGTWTDPLAGIALGHRRLSIIDLSPLGAQPMHSASGRWVITFNGEVFNFGELRNELAALGARFKGGSDTEVMLAAFDAWGIDGAIRRFVGMFAFAVWDRANRTLHLVRDRLGIKPLYWGNFGSLLVFGSELKALLACDGWAPELNRDAVASFSRWNYVPAPLSIWKGVLKLEPGTRLEFTAGAAPVVHRWWDLRSIAAAALSDPWQGSDAEAVDALDGRLRDAVRLRMVADVPLGAFLSGGTDSSLVVALMQAQSRQPVRSFSIGFNEPQYDEAVHAAKVAAHLGTQHTELYVGPAEAMSVIPQLAEYYDEPFADSSQVPTLLVSQMTRKHVTVALSGDGGDELFAGYTRYHWADLVRRRFLGLPSSFRRAIAAAIRAVPGVAWEAASKTLPLALRPQRVGERAGKLAGLLCELDGDAIYRRQHTHWPDPARLVLGGKEWHGLPFDRSLAGDVPGFLERMQLLDTLTYLPDDILTKVDRASMAVGLEARVPLLDHRVVEFAWRLPMQLKVRDRVTKWLPRQVLYRYVPPALLERPKMGFSLPLGQWLRGPLRPWAEALLDPNRMRSDGVFDPALVHRTWTAFQAGSNSDHEPIWGILMFQAWSDRWGRPGG